MAFPIRNYDPITCNQLIRPITNCRRNVRVKYNNQKRASEYWSSIYFLLLNREIYFFLYHWPRWRELQLVDWIVVAETEKVNKGKGGGGRMTSENEVSILRVLRCFDIVFGTIPHF